MAEALSSDADHDRLVRIEAMYQATSARVDEFVEWKHQLLPPVIFSIQKDILEQAKAAGSLRAEIAALCGVVDKLASAVNTLLSMPTALQGHEDICIRARREDIEHRNNHEEWVAAQFAQMRNRQLGLHGTLLFSLLSAIGGMAWYIVMHLNPAILK